MSSLSPMSCRTTFIARQTAHLSLIDSMQTTWGDWLWYACNCAAINVQPAVCLEHHVCCNVQRLPDVLVLLTLAGDCCSVTGWEWPVMAWHNNVARDSSVEMLQPQKLNVRAKRSCCMQLCFSAACTVIALLLLLLMPQSDLARAAAGLL